MAQQINLCSPILLTQKKYFSANTMAASLGVFVLLGGLLTGAWAWKLRQASAGYEATMATQARDMASLQAAIAANKAATRPVDAAVAQQLEARQQQLSQRRALLAALQQGAMEPGNGYSDRLQFLASTIPAPVWVSAVHLAPEKFQVAGYTLEPEALNAWVTRMATHPLLQGLQLSDVQVKNVSQGKPAAGVAAGAQAAAVPASAARPTWSFELVNTRPAPVPAKPTETERKP